MALNLIRNARVFLTTNVNAATGVYGGHATTTSANTWEIQVQQGFSFSQATTTQNITLNEAGATPTRGQRAFNTALNPAEFSFNTYVRPNVAAGLVEASEKVLWNALLNNGPVNTANAGVFTSATTTTTTTDGLITFTTTGFVPGTLVVGSYITVTGFPSASTDWTGVIQLTAIPTATTVVGRYVNKPSTVYAAPTAANIKFYAGSGWAAGFGVAGGGATSSCSLISTVGTDVHQLQKFAIIVVADTQTYIINNCALDQATIDFALDAISSIAWTGKGTAIDATLTTPTLAAIGTTVATGTTSVLGYTSITVAAAYIQNKLSTVTLISNIGGVAGTSYTLALTGGSLQIQNNLNFKTPQNLGVVNTPIGYTTGVRAISGNIQAYLRTGTAGDAGSLLSSILAASATATDTKYRLQVEIGGSANGTRLEFETDGAMLSVPTIQTQDIVSTQINFVAQGTNQGATPSYDQVQGNELTVRYFSV
jgi:hypothetical protein